MVIGHNRKLLSGKQLADHFMNNFQKVPEERRKAVREAHNQFQDTGPEGNVMTTQTVEE